MKKYFTSFICLCFLPGIFITQLPAQSMVMSNMEKTAAWKAVQQPVRERNIHSIEKKFNISIGYKVGLLDRINDRVDLSRYASPEEALKALLKDSGLTYKKVGSRFYAILEAKPAAIPDDQPVREKTGGQSSARPQLVIAGKVTDQEGNSLPGVTIAVRGTSIGTVTDDAGNYKLTVPGIYEDATLVFSSVGYVSQSVKVNGRTTINMLLSPSTSALDQVVVIGYGTQKRKDLTGSISSIDAKQMDHYPGGSINTSLQGKIAGLQVTVNSGEPGAGANIVLRGVSSINGSSQPLIIIDGIPVNNDAYNSLDDGASFSPLNDINPSDVKSIEVLKDAASASIYGSRASNGVILITTKTGRGKKPQINLSANTSVVKLGREIGVLNAPEWRNAYIEAIYNSTGELTPSVAVIDSLHPYYRNSYNWQDILFRQAVQYKIDMSVSGTSKGRSMSYYASAGYKNLQPIAVHTSYKQVYGNFHLNYTINKFIEGRTNFNLSNYNYSRISSGGESSVLRRALTTIPVYSPYDPITGKLIPLFEESKTNPLAAAIYATHKMKRWRLLGKQQLDFHLVKGLDFRTSLGLDYSNTEAYYYAPPILSTVSSSKNIYSYYSPTTFHSFINENTLTYSHVFSGKHHVNFLLGESYEIRRSNYLYLRGQGSIDNQITNISGAAAINKFRQSLTEHVLQSFFTRLNYNYKEKYLLSVVLRRDGSSRFGKDNRYGYFPAISAGWRFSDESFFKNSHILTDGKLRIGYGITGNESIGDYAAQGSFSKAGSYLGEVAIVADDLPNENLRWETTRQTDIGVDLSFLRDRIGLTADVYLKKTYNLLFNVHIPDQTGYGSIPYNFGSLQNKGFDFTLNGVILNKPITWEATITFGLNRNKIISLPQEQDYRPNGISLARVGQPVGVFYGLKALGVYATDADNVYKKDAYGQVVPYRKGSAGGFVYKGGDVIWDDLNGDGVINDNDLQIIGDPTPEFFGGLQTDLSYKNLSLNLFFHYVYGNQIYNNVVNKIDGHQFKMNYSTDQLRRWREQGDITDVPRLVNGDPMQNYAVSDRYVEDGSFVRLQTIALNYNLPRHFADRVGVTAIKAGVSVSNLLTWSPYSGYDPEVSAGYNPLEFGQDNGSLPRSKSFNLYLNIKF